MSRALAEGLEALYASTDFAARRDRDPVAFPHRFAAAEDQEIAAFWAACFAYGRVDLFMPLLERLGRDMEAEGGPRSWIESERPIDLYYRFYRREDLEALRRALRELIRRHGSLGAAFQRAPTPTEGLERVAKELEALLPEGGARFALPAPSGGSACKRGNMLLRWMVRPAREGVDFGIWSAFSPADLVIPLDVHVHRVARLLGLTRRADGGWRTAVEVTAALRAFDARDPVRFDFAIAHLGIGGRCEGRRAPACYACPLRRACSEGSRAA